VTFSLSCLRVPVPAASGPASPSHSSCVAPDSHSPLYEPETVVSAMYLRNALEDTVEDALELTDMLQPLQAELY
jgi:hypothetical protein